MEIVLIIVVLILLFGTRKLPELLKGIGKSKKAFKDGKNETPVN